MKIPPHDIVIEQAILSVLMVEPTVLDDVVDYIAPAMFYNEANKLIAKAIISIYSSGGKVDLITVNKWLNDAGLLDQIGGTYYLAETAHKVTGSANIQYHALLLKQMHVQRTLIEIGTGLTAKAYHADPYVLGSETLQEVDDAINMRGFTNVRQAADIIKDWLPDFEQAIVDGKRITGLRTGFAELDYILEGLHAGLYIIAARPGMGKSTVAAQMVINMCTKYGYHVLLSQMEMQEGRVMGRLFSSFAGVSRDDLDKMGTHARQQHYANFKSSPINNMYMDSTAAIDVHRLRSRAKRLQRQGKLDAIVVDYLQLMSTTEKTSNRTEEVSKISAGLKKLSADLNIPVIALAQLNRDVEKTGHKKPSLSDLKESGRIEEDAEAVIMLYRPELYDENATATIANVEYSDVRGLMGLLVRKNRNGKIAEIPMCCNMAQYRVWDYEAAETNFNPFPAQDSWLPN